MIRDSNKEKLKEFKQRAYKNRSNSDFVMLRFHIIELIKQSTSYNHLRAIINEIYLELTEKFKVIRNKDVTKLPKSRTRRDN